MPSTTRGDVFVPEIATEVATATFPERLALGFTGSPFVQPFPPSAALGDEGDTVKFPRWDPFGSFEDMSDDTALTPEKLSHSVDSAVVQVGGKAVEITDFADLAARGDPSAEAGRQMAVRAGEYADDKLVTEAETTSLVDTSAASSTITWDLFTAALQAQWGDKAYEAVGGLVVHSKVWSDLTKLTEFTDSQNVVGQADFSNRQRGERSPVGFFGGWPVYVSDQLTVISGTPDQYDNLVLKRGALGLRFQRQLLVESDRDILNKSDVIAGDVRLAVHLMFDDPLPCFIFRTQ